MLQQVSIGGCYTGWEENIFTGDEFRLEIGLPNGNWLPLACKAVYRFENTGVGVKFLDITRFEQSLVAEIIREKLRLEGLPMDIDPFVQPPAVVPEAKVYSAVHDERRERDEVLDKVMSGEECT